MWTVTTLWACVVLLLSCQEEVRADQFLRHRRSLTNSNTVNHSVVYEESTDPAIQRFFHTRRELLQVFHGHHNHSDHKKAWMSLAEVDGLKNEEVIMMVTSTASQGEVYLWERIIPSARTWMKYFANVFVIIEDSIMIRYALRHCEVHDYPTNTAFVCHNEPTYILSRTCTNEYYGAAGPCCKVDEIYNHLVNDRADFFKNIKFSMHCDDDTYFRPDQILKWLATIDKAGLDDIPIIANSNRGHKGDTAMGVWHINGCTEVQSSGWYQPLMMNHAAMQRISVAVKSKGITDTCRHFDVTHDVGVETFAWIMGLNHIQIPRTEINGNHMGVDIFQPDQLIVHSLRHDDKDHCRPGHEETWPAKLRYNQKVVVGCGDIGTPSPFHDKKRMADMYDAFEYFRDNGKPLEFGKAGVYEYERFNCSVEVDGKGKKKIKKIWKASETPTGAVEELVIPTVTPLEGYSETDHGKKNDLSKKWVAYKMTDCKIPGSVGH